MLPYRWMFEHELKHRLTTYVFPVSKKTKWKRARR